MKCGLLLNIGRLVVALVNLVFLLIGLVLFLIGLIVKYGDTFKSYYSSVIPDLETALSQAGFSNATLDFNIEELAGSLTTSFILSGFIILIFTFLAIVAVLRKIKCLLLLYSLIMLLLLVAEIVVMGILYGQPSVITNPIKSALKSTITSDYGGFNGTNVVSLGWNIVHQKYSCCGVDSYADFTSATNWVYNYTTSTGDVLSTPLSCCVTLPESNNFTCAVSPLHQSLNYYNTGCFSEIWSLVIGNLAITIPVIVGCIILQVIIVLTVIFLYQDNKQKVKPTDNSNVRVREKPKTSHTDETSWDF